MTRENLVDGLVSCGQSETNEGERVPNTADYLHYGSSLVSYE